MPENARRVLFETVTKLFFMLVLGLPPLIGLPRAAEAQPFGAWLVLSGNGAVPGPDGYVEVPDSPALTPGSAMTIEAWVSLATPFPAEECRSLVGKDFQSSYWLGVCGGTVRASFRGLGSDHTAGVVPPGQWTHIAVTYDGTTQKHYVNGELIQSFPVGGPPAASPGAALRIGSDVSWQRSPSGGINEVRLWSVARTIDQIRGTINVPVTTPMPELVAVWRLSATPNDVFGVHNGTLHGTTTFLAPPANLTCGSSSSGALCLDGRYLVTAGWRTGTASGAGTTVPVANPGSGIFWFFAPVNWEVMVKVIDACSLNDTHWVFFSATTNVFFRLEVTDVASGQTKVYFSYEGPPAPAVTDTAAFPGSCP
ncbi:MAG: LamG domain-containing protein [Acidobacteriota bacterium]|nr:LamG domain-containing protein [Acidobacteriota bacterium]